MDYILEVEELTKKYKNSDFMLNHVSFRLPYGSIMGYIGENGAGKTTTISCIINAIFKESGTVRLLGREMSDEDVSLREEIGVVFDAGNFPGHLDPAKLSGIMNGIYRKWDDGLFQSYLQKFRIPMDKKIRSLSRGMSMKLSIAAALAHKPSLLILDEATSGLDPIVRDEMLDVFLDFVQDEKHSILLSSHITSDLEKIADYITFIHNGNIIMSETKDELIYDYTVARCKASQFAELEKNDIIAHRQRGHQIDVLMKHKKEMERKYKNLLMDPVSIDDIMLLMVKGETR